MVKEVKDKFRDCPICPICKTEMRLNFQVEYEVWRVVAPTGMLFKEICLTCFDRLAAEKNIEYHNNMVSISFEGKMCRWTFEPVTPVVVN